MQVSSSLICVMLCVGMLTLAVNIQPAWASGTVYIRSDGSIDPPTALIQRNGHVYTLTGNVTSDANGIVVEKNNIVVDGSKFAVEGTGPYPLYGIYLDERSNVTIQNVYIVNFYDGIWLNSSSSNFVSGNTITNSGGDGIGLYYSSNNSVSGNTITNNWYGIGLDYSSNNSVSENAVTNNDNGVWLNSFSDDNSVSGNTVTSNYDGIGLSFSSGNGVNGNTITNNDYDGISLGSSSDNRISSNVITSNTYGIGLDYSFNNTVFHNNFINNTIQVYEVTPDYANSWDNGREGNYWSDYNGTDENHDGIGDTPHIVDANNTDHYPLMDPYIIPEFPTFFILFLLMITSPITITIYGKNILKKNELNRLKVTSTREKTSK